MTRAARTAMDADLVSGVYDALNDRRLDELLGRLDPAVEFWPLPLPQRTRCHGHDEVRHWWREFKRQDVGLRIKIEERCGSENGDVIAAGWVEAGGVSSSFVGLHRLRDGKVVVLHDYFSDLATVRRLGLAD